MTAEAIGRVVADLQSDRVLSPPGLIAPGAEGRSDLEQYSRFWRRRPDAKVVDCTAIYRSLAARDQPVYLYEDHPCVAPPFPAAYFCYENGHGNVFVMTALALDHQGESDGLREDTADSLDRARPMSQPEGWVPAEPVDWARVRWTIDTFLWVGGRGGGKPAPTTGPCHLWRFAVYDDGAPADLHWVRLLDYPMERWDMAHLVLLGALNFLNCRNVDLVEPKRPRAEARRVARTGVRVSEISVFPAGSTSRGGGGGTGAGVPLASVRGHFAHYGACCPGHEPRGLLFGRQTGRFWIPQHARGSAELGETESSYRLVQQ